ncbi:hypothetical protein [Halorubrum trueperi]|uniref:Dolichyl-phosphate-mannose-protein mannosyltransferase n=1 Tax=Halorubrum trueperi TaxID=2004704 RepID=A0ABD5UIV0_9EURY
MTDNTAAVVHKAALTVGFLAFAFAIVSAHTTPATGYELSIYRATPLRFWGGVGVGFLVAAVVLFGARSRRLVDGAALLAGGCLLAVVSIPLLRSYAFYGAGDAMTHLGWAREIQTGVIGPDAVLYPAIHLIAVELGALSGLDLTETLQFAPALLFPGVYLVSIPLCLEVLSGSRWAVPTGIAVAVLLLPINKVSVHILAHPSSQAILFTPFVLYLLFRYLGSPGRGFSATSATGAAFGLAALGMVFVHPQETMALVSVLVAVAGLQLVVRRYRPTAAIASHRPIGVHTVVVGTVLVAWLLRHERATSRFEGVVSSLVTSGATTGDGTAERGASLVALGGSVEELFLKLFAVTTIFCVLAGAVALYRVAGRPDPARPWRNAAVTYLSIGLLPPTGIFVVVFLAEQGDHYFRFQGFIMVIVTILGALGIVALLERMTVDDRRRAASTAGAVVLGVVVFAFVLAVALQLAAVHQSPYIYQANQQVTDADFDARAVAFEFHDGETVIAGIRSGQGRYIDAHFGRETAVWELSFPGYGDDDAGVTGETFNTNLTTRYESDRYLMVGDRHERQEVDLYDGFRFSQAGFDRLDTDPRVERVQDNGGIRLYRIEGTDEDA